MLTREEIDRLRSLTQNLNVRFRWGEDAQGFFVFVGRDEPLVRSFCRTLGEAMSVLDGGAGHEGSDEPVACMG